jgi:transcription-repair coupling factor (superfamily II helicase)
LGQFLEMNVGDYVVHQRHGIGRFLGIQHITRVGVPGEYLSIEYANSAKLHVPLDQAYLVQKYLGVGDRPIQIDQLGSTRWEKTKARVLAATLLVAKDLLEVQAARKSLEGIPYSEDTPWQRDFENAFPYEETPDQITSIEQVKKDMTGPHPMDRLLCGDVGYGKTEVAIRAAFKAVMDQRQVAVLVPTTILAQQHLSTFQGRMADYPVRVEMLSRFRHPGQVRKILLDLVEGKIDVIIGTHRLLQGDVQFKDLGLVIIDEEQRFGVGHKEKLKKLRTLVDVLTMTATPIPRTLYLSLLGTKEMSTINTPPQDRLPVDTMLCEYDERLIRRAIRYELAREGQVFFVHNRVRTIEEMGRRVRRLVPEAKVVCAHGQMGEDLLSDIMSKFVTGQIDVLVTTTIIESGLDIPNANTLIVDRADRFGLSELYQLRGRVGRFKNKAYAYFLLPKDQVLLMSAKKRLKAIADFTALGSGFKIAMRDLEIRGAGNILGHQQHGHIAAVGFDLYCQLLKQSVTRLKSMPLPADQEVTVKIGQPLTIPADYVPSEGMRMDLYRRISAAHQEGEVQALREEILDRFGALPSSVELYLDVADIRILARSKGVFHSEAKNGKWFLRRGKDLITVNGKLPEQHAKNAKEAATELKNVLKKLPDEVRMNGLERSVHEKTL